MIRPMTLVTLLAAMGAGLHLYQTKHAVALLDRELRGIGRSIEAAQERSVALAAEWARLNEPERLRAVAQRHLQLEPMQPTQFVRMADAERRIVEAERRLPPPPTLVAFRDPLPDPRAMRPAPTEARPETAPVPEPAVGVGRAASVVASRPVPPPASPMPSGESTPPTAAAEPARVAVAVARAPALDPRPRSTAAPRMPSQPVALVAASAPRNALLPGVAQASTVAAPVQAPVSSLGGAGSLPPPVPFAR